MTLITPGSVFGEQAIETSPFTAFRLIDLNYLANPQNETFDLVSGVSFRDYTRLYLQAHGIRYVVVFHRPEMVPEMNVHLDRLRALLRDAMIYDDGTAAIYDRDRLPTPARPVLLTTRGWGQRLWAFDRRTSAMERTGHVMIWA